MQFLAFGGCTDARRSATRSTRAGVDGRAVRGHQRSARPRAADVQRGSRLLPRSRAADAEPAAVRVAHAEARVHDARPHLLARLRAGSAGRAAAPAAAHGAEPAVEVGGLVSAAAERPVRAAAAPTSSA